MPASTPRWPSRPAHSPRRCFAGDSQGVTEVIGYLLVFGILSMILLLSMVAFNIAQEAARDRAVELRAESAAARVAGVVVQAAVLAEQESSSAPVLLYGIDLPDQLEGLDYTVHLEKATTDAGQTSDCTHGVHADQVCVQVPALEIVVTAPLFSAGAPANVVLCGSSIPGGRIQVAFDDAPLPAGCVLPSGVTKAIFLQVSP